MGNPLTSSHFRYFPCLNALFLLLSMELFSDWAPAAPRLRPRLRAAHPRSSHAKNVVVVVVVVFKRFFALQFPLRGLSGWQVAPARA
jgi:hypothetical protein